MRLLGSMTFWTALGSIAAVIMAVYKVTPAIRWPFRRKRVFLSIQMSQLKDEQYERTWNDAMRLVGFLRGENYRVYFFNEDIRRKSDFAQKTFSACAYIDEIKRADYFIAITTERIFSSIYFEAGFALAMGKRSIYFSEPDTLPSLMQGIGYDARVTVVGTTLVDEIIPQIEKRIKHTHKRR